MNCCPHCFQDSVAREFVQALADHSSGVCDICGQKRDSVLSIRSESELADQFLDLIAVFSPPKCDCKSYSSLFEGFQDTWKIFNKISKDSFDRLIKQLLPDDERLDLLLEGEVCLDPSSNQGNPFDLSFFGTQDWIEFSNQIKTQQRFHTKIKNESVLRTLLSALELKVYPNDRSWYRARNWNGKTENPTFESLKEPPPNIAIEGRMNPYGISYLYISSSPQCALAEIRASKHDEIAVMEMLPKIPLRILDLSKVDKISPFNENVNFRMLASNLNNLRQIKDALTQPMRKNDNIIEYVPTQYLASYALSIGFDGIGYSSILASGSDTEAFNIASFKGFEEAFICKSISMHKIKDVSTVDESTEIIL